MISPNVRAFILFLLSCVFFGFIRTTKKDPNHPTVISALPEKGPVRREDSLKVYIGKLLFWDPVLSGNKKVACATCHNPANGYTDNLDLSIGVDGEGAGSGRHFIAGNEGRFAKRNSPTLLNVIFNGIDSVGKYDPKTAPMFWDNRAKSLELQAIVPLTNHAEMRGDAYDEKAALDSVVRRIKAIKEYVLLFEKAFGKKEAVSTENIINTLTLFEGTLLANNSPFDRYMRGDETAMSDSQLKGMKIFVTSGCASCHNGPMFSDYKLHVLGVPDNVKLDSTDRGANATYAFRTPSLRNLNYTWPYFHNGTFDRLADAVSFYRDMNLTGQINSHIAHGQIDAHARSLGEFDTRAILNFLEALNDHNFDRKVPSRVPSKLQVGGNIN